MNIKDFKVDDEVIIVTSERDYINGGTKDVTHTERIISIGRKYVTTTRYGERYYHNKYMAKDYLPDGLVQVEDKSIYLFKSIEDYKRHVERKTLIRQLYDKLHLYSDIEKLNYEQLIAILTIIEEE